MCVCVCTYYIRPYKKRVRFKPLSNQPRLSVTLTNRPPATVSSTSFIFVSLQRFAQFSEDLVTKDATFQDLHLRIDAAFTHDAAELTLTSVRRLSSLNYSASNLRVELMKAKMQTVTVMSCAILCKRVQPLKFPTRPMKLA